MTERSSGASLDAGSALGHGSVGEVPDGLGEVATDPGCRSTLATVRAEGPLTVSELAAELATNGEPHGGSGDDAHSRTSIALRHSHLPRLADAGLVEVDHDGGSVVVRASDAVDAAALDRIEALADREHGELLLSVLTAPDRRYAAEYLSLADEAVPVSAIAESIASRAVNATQEPYGSAVESARISLHHVHLPALEAAGLVEYDADELRVVPLDFPEPLSDVLTS